VVVPVSPHSPVTANAVDPESVYELGVDSDADAVIDIAFRVRRGTVPHDGLRPHADLRSDLPV
jgi:hypothetical protein